MGIGKTNAIGRLTPPKKLVKPGFLLIKFNVDRGRQHLLRNSSFGGTTDMVRVDSSANYNPFDIQLLILNASFRLASRAWSSGGDSAKIVLEALGDDPNFTGGEALKEDDYIESSDCDDPEISSVSLARYFGRNTGTFTDFELRIRAEDQPTFTTICTRQVEGTGILVIKESLIASIPDDAGIITGIEEL